MNCKYEITNKKIISTIHIHTVTIWSIYPHHWIKILPTQTHISHSKNVLLLYYNNQYYSKKIHFPQWIYITANVCVYLLHGEKSFVAFILYHVILLNCDDDNDDVGGGMVAGDGNRNMRKKSETWSVWWDGVVVH